MPSKYSLDKISFNSIFRLYLTCFVFFGTSVGKRRHFTGIQKYIDELPSSTAPSLLTIFKQSRLCTATNDIGAPFRYHKPTRQCYIVGERGPCGAMMEFTLVDRDYGICDCSQKLRCGRPLLYWPEEKRCYLVNEQGPCITGKWLVFGLYRTPVCKRNSCEQHMRRNPSRGSNFWFENGGKCYRTGTKGFCSSNQTLVNNWRDYKPTCLGTEFNLDCRNGQVSKADCLPGMRIDHSDSCIRSRIKSAKFEESIAPVILQKIYHLTLE